MMDNDSIYFDYVRYELPVLSVSDNNMYEMFESIVISTINCENDSKSFDIEKISYIMSVCNVNGYDMEFYMRQKIKKIISMWKHMKNRNDQILHVSRVSR